MQSDYVYETAIGRPKVAEDAFIAPTACVVGDVEFGPRSSLWYGAVARGDTSSIKIGADTNIQDCSTLHSDPTFPLTVGDRVSVGHSVVLHGATVHDDVLIGMGAVVMNGCDIGSWTIVAAGAVVTQGTIVPEGSLVAGVPAKVIRQATDKDRAQIAANAESYTGRLDIHRRAKRVPLR
ncbi:carbonic anhydrase/acetyltransferase-like protein (isoleucine patch superfamily) [Antricoccus suffuscus]|uniref:Carbonic anhydrase/acetyltransferase-like protein (Isoleucine patch superfamily) n=1 Tax=Antricoccus suffuscus TaxID=1629062 RepID=A0A2T0Z8P9_9ACTN|nr:gamma carbonic anhydrase family protein [Antricoccus suffuscus]PRZ32733.1 carbonic anhydrase/acetyltransferase-like protein (isoleucine patch superfamily) [Antricoccus suffuscus]